MFRNQLNGKEYDMGLGKQIRLKRVFSHASGRLFSVAVDHFIGYQQGLPCGLVDLPATLEAIVKGAPDAITMHKGIAMSCWAPFAGSVPLIIQSIIGTFDDVADESITTPEDAALLGADAFATCAFVRGNTEASHLRRVADFVRQAQRLDMPLILHTYPRQFNSDGSVEVSFESEDIAWAVHCGIEVGADIIKVPFTGDAESYAQIVRTSPIPIVAAGGPKAETLLEALCMANRVVESGARGMTVGRNVWSFSDIPKAVLAFKAVIHDRLSPEEAMKKVGLES